MSGNGAVPVPGAASVGVTRQFGEYAVIRRLGYGGMAEVFLARWRRFEADRAVVVKSVLPHLHDDAEFIEMFRDEVRVLAGLEHPNIVHVFDAGESEGTPYFVMEFVDGCTLKDALAAGPLAPELVAGIGIELARALWYAHSRPTPVVHRDVKPHNVLINREGVVKLTDFGIAKVLGQAGRAPTTLGTVKGSLPYLSPEQVRYGAATPASDQYALGLVLFEALTGERAVPAGNDLTLLRWVSDGLWRHDLPQWNDVPAELRATIGRMLETDPTQRWASLRAVQQSLQGYLVHADMDGWDERLAQRVAAVAPAEAAAPVPPPMPTRAMPLASTRSSSPLRAPLHARWWYGLLLAGACVAVALAWRLWPREQVLPRAERPATPAVQRSSLPAVDAPTSALHAPVAKATRQAPRPAAHVAVAPDRSVRRSGLSVPAASHPATAVATGRLVVQVLPWADVALDGVHRGTTPWRHDVAAGRYRVELRNEPLGWSLVTTVTVPGAGEAVVRAWIPEGGTP